MKIDCTTCKYGYEDERLGIPMCHHPKRFSEDCINFNMHEESEKPMAQKGLDVTDFCKPIDPGIAQCIADHSWEMLGEDEKSVPKDLEEAAEKYGDKHANIECAFTEIDEPVYIGDIVEQAFIAGAKWDRSQMLNEAVEGKIQMRYSGCLCAKTIRAINEDKFKFGDKVRLIVLKAEEE